MNKKPQKSAGRKAESGNVTVVDFGEKHYHKIDQMVNKKLEEAGVSLRAEMSGKKTSASEKADGSPASIGSSRSGRPFMGRPGNVLSGYRPGGVSRRFGERPALGSRSGFGRPSLGSRPGYGRNLARPGFGRPSLGSRPGGGRPWYQRFGGRPWMGQESATVPSGRTYLIPASVQQVKTSELLTGGAIGLVANRALVRLTPLLWKTISPVANDGLAFVATLIPLAFKRNATTVGVALPSAVILGARLLDMVFNWMMPTMPAVGSNGGAMQGGQDATWQARQKLANIQSRINQPQMAASRQPLPRVVAHAQ